MKRLHHASVPKASHRGSPSLAAECNAGVNEMSCDCSSWATERRRPDSITAENNLRMAVAAFILITSHVDAAASRKMAGRRAHLIDRLAPFDPHRCSPDSPDFGWDAPGSRQAPHTAQRPRPTKRPRPGQSGRGRFVSSSSPLWILGTRLLRHAGSDRGRAHGWVNHRGMRGDADAPRRRGRRRHGAAADAPDTAGAPVPGSRASPTSVWNDHLRGEDPRWKDPGGRRGMIE